MGTPSDQSSLHQPSSHHSERSNPISAVVNGGKKAVGTIVGLGGTATNRAVRWIERLTQGAGRAATLVGNFPLLQNPVVRRLAGVLRLDWLTGISDRVDISKAEAEVKQLQHEYPGDSPSQLAHRIMVRKAVQGGKIGFASSLLPGIAVALLAIDLAATTVLQTEMLYQIAAAYGLNLRAPARKGEILAIFGLALGGGKALRAGLGVLRNVPLAGAVIGASTNATMLYSLGYAASRFYEAKSRSETPEPNTETLKALQAESEEYLDIAIAQQRVMDQILAHMIVASYPEKHWKDIVPELKALHLDSSSLTTIEANLQSPKPLDVLLKQLNCDFAVPLLAQCRYIAESNGTVSQQENYIMNAIAESCRSIMSTV